MKKETEELGLFLKKYSFAYILALIIIWAVFAKWIIEFVPGADTTALYFSNGHHDANWMGYGRWGLVLTGFIFRLHVYNPVFNDVIGFFFLYFAGIIFSYCFYRFADLSGVLGAVFTYVFIMSPFLLEQLYFRNQIFQIGFAYVLISISIFFVTYNVKKRSIPVYIVSIFLTTWAFASYQVFVIMYFCVCILLYILINIKNLDSKDSGLKKYYIQYILNHIGVFISSAVLWIISEKIIGQNDYVESQILWGTMPFSKNLYEIAKNIFYHSFGRSIHGTVLFAVFFIILFVYLSIQAIRKKSTLYGVFILSIIGFYVSAYLLNIYVGGTVVLRTQLIYSIVLAGGVVITINMFKDFRIKVFAVILTIACLVHITNTTSRFIYTDLQRGEYDKRIISSFMDKVEEVRDHSKPIAIIGELPNYPENNLTYTGEHIGKPTTYLFNDVSPHYFYSTIYAIQVGYIMNYDVGTAIKQEQMVTARKAALSMPSWPQPGSVKDIGEIVVVKLSEDAWPEEL